MLGRDHALSGAVAFAALASSLHAGQAYLPAGVVLTAGAGVLPDIDHPDSTISRSFGFLTEWFAWLVDRVSGGHRHGTHSLLGIAVFTAGAYGAGRFQLSGPRSIATGNLMFSWHIVPAALILALLYSSALRALRIGGHHGDLLGIAAAAVTCYTGADLTQLTAGSWHVPLLAAATGLGCAAHIAGDELTHGGCPLFWPVSMHEFHLLPRPLQITTAKLCETWVIFPLLVAGLAAAVWHATGHPLAIPRFSPGGTTPRLPGLNRRRPGVVSRDGRPGLAPWRRRNRHGGIGTAGFAGFDTAGDLGCPARNAPEETPPRVSAAVSCEEMRDIVNSRVTPLKFFARLSPLSSRAAPSWC